jgi:ATP-binding cassette subfamily B protein
MRRKKAIRIQQRDISDCGAACLASIAAYHRLRIPVSRIRQYAGTDKRGSTMLGLTEAAEKLGFQAKAARGKPENLGNIPLPAIAHVIFKSGLQHYIVLYQAGAKHIRYMDPRDGALHRETIDQFKEKWTGVILLLPGEEFLAGSQKISNAKRFWQLLSPHTGLMLQALIGAAVYTLLGLSFSVYMQKIVDFVLPEGNLKLLNLLGVIMVALLFFQAFIGAFKTILGMHTGQMIDARLILGYYKHLLRLPQRFFDTMRVGEIISRVNDAVKIRVFINDVALNIVVNTLIICFSIGLMFLYYWKLALIILTILPLYMLLFWISNKVNKKWNRTLMEQSAELETQLVESLNAIGTVRRFGLEEYANLKTENKFVHLLRSVYRSGKYGLFLGTSADFITRLFTIILLWAGSYFVIDRELTPGELLSFYALIGYLTGPAASLIGANKGIQDALIAADRLFEIIDLETEGSDEHKMTLTPALVGDIHFNKVSFRYGTRALVFDNLSLLIKKGESTGIIGESGSGKSTILSLLQHLYPVKEGNITIGGLDLQYITNASLRQMICAVPQHIDLFAGTVIENIAIGVFEPDLPRIMQLCRMLGIDEFIEQLPASYNSILTEQGNNLSGGQRQRIAVARALYRNPEILILDEATASLDPASEEKVQQTLEWFKKENKTVIIIAHRLSFLRNCDNILVLEHGRLLEHGSHHELLQFGNLYSDYWKKLSVQ